MRLGGGASARAHQQSENAVLRALQIECGGTIEIKGSHAMQNSPEFVEHGINIGG
jgi:hypothetical protein